MNKIKDIFINGEKIISRNYANIIGKIGIKDMSGLKYPKYLEIF